MPWDEKSMAVNLNWGSHLFLKIVFLTNLASKYLEMHAQAMIQPGVLLPHVAGDSWGIRIPFFCNFLHFSMVGISVLNC